MVISCSLPLVAGYAYGYARCVQACLLQFDPASAQMAVAIFDARC
jgi:hypothetical protein